MFFLGPCGSNRGFLLLRPGQFCSRSITPVPDAALLPPTLAILYLQLQKIPLIFIRAGEYPFIPRFARQIYISTALCFGAIRRSGLFRRFYNF
jgi:hypothetical protein